MLFAFAFASASAATFTVTNTNDSGAGSLRQAVADANLAASDDIIEISVTGTIALTTGELTIDDAAVAGKLTISGPSAELLVISGNSNNRVFMNQYGADTTIEKVTVADGWNEVSGGGIYNSGTLAIYETVLRDNVASDYEFNGFGGAIYNNGGTVTLKDCTVNDNASNNGYGGGIYNFGGTLTVRDSTFRRNFTSGGGAIGSFGGTLTIYTSTLDSNAGATGGIDSGGGIYSFSDVATIIRSTISNSFANDAGSGITNELGDMTIHNSTISDNSGASSEAAGVYNAGGAVSINNSTIVNNGDVGLVSYGTTTLSNTIVAMSNGNFDVSGCGSIVSLGYNLIGNADSCFIFGGPPYQAGPGDQLGTVDSPIDPLLGPLQDNGGPTQTHALLTGSPAIDIGGNALIPAGTITDQRGFLRVVNGTVDIGAYEFGDGVLAIVDIKPGKTPNSINLKSKGKIPVAILTTDTFLAFNEVDPLSVEFGPAGATESHGRAHVKDVDDDGDMDLLLHFNTQETGIACGDIEATLTGMTFGGYSVIGADAINTVNCPRYSIGDEGPAGGIVFYVTDGGLHGLEAAPEDQSAGVEWGCWPSSIDGAEGKDVGAGEQNTADILVGCSERPIAASVADDYELNGFTDWFLPSRDTLNEMYLNRAVIGGFAEDVYWSSSEGNIFTAFGQAFDQNGSQFDLDRINEIRVRAVRAF